MSHDAGPKRTCHDANAPMRWMIVSILVALPAYAQADLLKHALDGQSPGGTGSSATAPTSQENDLVTWAGEAKPITLPELLQLAIRQAPALASARAATRTERGRPGMNGPSFRPWRIAKCASKPTPANWTK